MAEAERVGEEPVVVTGSREQLLYLLAEAAEIEHTLMCSYLYAAFSLRSGEEEGLSDTQAVAVKQWRRTIMNVAIEEMGHLLLVANLTVAIGGRPHFARPSFPVPSGYFPSGVAVRLRGFSMETLEHFIFLERPQGVEGAENDAFEQEDYSREQVYRGLMPSAQDYATIGHLYEAIRANLVSLAAHLGEGRLFIGGIAGQVGRGAIHLKGVEPIDRLDAACAAIDVIVEQGEGSPADREESHYRSFLTIREEFETLAKIDPHFAPARPVAESPVMRRPPEPEGKVFIDNPEAAAVLDFCCATYGLLLRLLVQSFGRSGPAASSDQKQLISAAIDLMHVLGSASDTLARLPASPRAPGINAGMSFTMLRGVEPMLAGSAEEQLVREQMRSLADGARALPISSAVTARLDKLADKFSLSENERTPGRGKP
jgi:ferritin-like protein